MLRYSSLSNNSITTTNTSPEIQALHQRRLQEMDNAQAPSSPNQNILGLHLGDSPRFQNNAFNKTIDRHN
jgi:hypothetical protein